MFLSTGLMDRVTIILHVINIETSVQKPYWNII